MTSFTKTEVPAIIPSKQIESSKTPQKQISKTPTTSPTTLLPTPGASIPLSTDGPWLIFLGESGLWVVNSDGSGLRLLVDAPSEYYTALSSQYAMLPFEASPDGKRLAYSSAVVEGSVIEQERTLYLLSFPDLSLKKVITLYSDESKLKVRDLQPPVYMEPVPTEQEEFVFEYKSRQIRGAIALENIIAWSSDGGQLAFSAAVDGPSADVYVLDIESSTILRVTDGPKTQPVNLTWTPENEFIIHPATEELNTGRDGPEF